MHMTGMHAKYKCSQSVSQQKVKSVFINQIYVTIYCDRVVKPCTQKQRITDECE